MLVAMAISHATIARAGSEDSLYQKLTADGKESRVALADVLKRSNTSSAVILYVASGVALREKQVEDAAFLFYVARIRAQFDKQLFPPTGTGGDNPMLLFGALQQQLGEAINPAVMADPKIFANALARVKAWKPEAPADCRPGWEFKERESESAALESIRGPMQEFLTGMTGMSTLLQDEKYFAAFQVARAYNWEQGSKRPSRESFDEAMKTMEQIEREKGIPGVATKLK